MKKILLILAITSLATISWSQNHRTSIGLKGGSGIGLGGGGINLKHFLSGSNAIEVTLGGGHRNIRAQVLYEWQKSTGLAEGLDWYIGVGGDVGAWSGKYNHPVHGDYNRGLYLGAVAVLGLDWNIKNLTDVPLDFAIDTGPHIGLLNSGGFGWGGAFAIRYVLK